MSPFLARARALLPVFLARLTARRDSGPIDTVDGLAAFVSTRAAFIAQKTLYGYMKTRMGTRYPTVFENDEMILSIDIAKLHIYAACLADLALFAASRTRAGAAQAIPDEACRALALACFRRGLADNAAPAAAVDAFSAAAVEAEFERRLAFWDWVDGPKGAEIFSESPAALVRWAPIAPELKQLDREIVENSIKFKWREVRADLDRRLDAGAVAAEARRQALQPA
ncbi:MAG TPA: hypothetical protein VKP12_02740 [Kiloniellaceae bacterium]|nr:hypothetical protein [Kiloniellaceae bacterium]